ncbi:MAG TPA: DUF1697 domain-containing protein [Sphingomicrobium sp.]|nr:DUF1697 domain-containing protein [Sphingomicrobium sp.]
MTSYVALLRSVNLLGTSTLKMVDLRSIAEEVGLASPRTFIASGNLLFTSSIAEEELRQLLERRVELHMGRPVSVMVRTAEEIEAVHHFNPFPEAAGNNTLAFFMNEAPPPDLIATVRNRAEDERIAVGPREIYVAYGERGIGRSRLRVPAAEAGTARNMNTVAKLAILAKELA